MSRADFEVSDGITHLLDVAQGALQAPQILLGIDVLIRLTALEEEQSVPCV